MERLTLARSPLLFDLAAGLVAATLLLALPVYMRLYTDPGLFLIVRLVLLLQIIPDCALALMGRALRDRPALRRAYWTVVAVVAILALIRVVQGHVGLGLAVLPLQARLAIYAVLVVGIAVAVTRWSVPALRGFAQLWIIAMLVTAAMAGQLILLPSEAGASPRLSRDDSVFIFVFDELSRDALMADGTIDGRRFPNIRRFADEALWFSDATSNYGDTCRGVPAMVTGRFLEDTRTCLRFVLAEEDNLLVDLSRAYQVTILEEYIYDCRAPRAGFECHGTAYLTAQYPHLALAEIAVPRSLRLGGVGEIAGLTASPFSTAAFREFVASVTAEHARGRAHLVHILLPHTPYVLDEMGTAHGSSDTVFKGPPETQPGVYENYLRQIGYVDRLFGEFLDRLRAEGLYDTSTVVLLGDSGPRVDPQPGPEMHSVSANVPLIVRSPDLPSGVTDVDYQTVDLRATLLDLLDLPAVPTDGVSAFDPVRPAREKVFAREDTDSVYRFDPATRRWLRSEAR